MARQYYADDGSGVARTTAAGTTLVTKASVTFTPDASSTYLILAMGTLDAGANLQTARITGTDGTTTFFDHVWKGESGEQPNGRRPFFHPFTVTSGGSPASTTYSVKFASGASNQTAGCSNARVLALKLTGNDQSVAVAGAVANSTTSYANVTGATITLTAGTKLLIATASNAVTSGTLPGSKVSGLVNGTAFNECSPLRSTVASNYLGWWGAQRFVASGSEVFSVQHAATVASTTSSTKETYLVALHVADLPSTLASYAESASETSASVGSFTSKNSLTATPPAVAHLVLATATIRSPNTSTAATQTAQLAEGGTLVDSAQVAPSSSSSAASEEPDGLFRTETPSGASSTWAQQHQSSNATLTAFMSDAGLYLIQLADTPSTARARPALTPDAVAAQSFQPATWGV